jgi:hypothetical protein
MAFPEWLPEVEQKIIGNLVQKALDGGLTVSAYDGEEWALKHSSDFEKITSEVGQTCSTELRFRRALDQTRVGDVLLIHGNEEDVISDHSDNPEVASLVS